MSGPRHQRRFHEELDRLQDRLMEMAGLSEDLVRRAVDAFLERDGDALAAIKADDRRIDALEVELDERVVALIALHQPVASDLRQVLSTLKIANDIERVGDHAHNIAKAARRSANARPLREIPELAELAVLAQRMLGDALASLGSRDSARARGVCGRDDRVDDMKAAVQKILVRVMSEEPESIRPALESIRVAQQLERIGDLSTNISEEVVFLVEGRSIKHHLGGGGATRKP
ncbi:MAG: phosphate signaling complex protein PhoU [Longimicrobiales bacterium]